MEVSLRQAFPVGVLNTRLSEELAKYTHFGYALESGVIKLPSKAVQFIEAPAFSRYREDYLDDNAFLDLQCALILNPEAGDLVPGAGGVRKLRWKDSRRGKGKRGGLRVIYYCFLADEEIWLLTLYDKSEASDLTKDEKDLLRRALEAERSARKGEKR